MLEGLVRYYQYSGDPATIAHITYTADTMLDTCLTPHDHPWPDFLVSVPRTGKPYYNVAPDGFIQLDITAQVGIGLLHAYEMTGNARWLRAVKGWGDVFAEHADLTPGHCPWPRYPQGNGYRDPTLTGGLAEITLFLDELIKMGYTGKDGSIIQARDAGTAYIKDVLLPAWLAADTWGRDYWDGIGPYDQIICVWTVNYMMNQKNAFPNWRSDARNILALFFNRSSADPHAGSDVFTGAWAYPESAFCCGKSFWYSPIVHGADLCEVRDRG